VLHDDAGQGAGPPLVGFSQGHFMNVPAIRGFVFAPIAAAIIEGVAKFDIGAYAFALIVAYPLTVILGIPGYLLLRRRRTVRLWEIVVLGCALGALSGLILTLSSAGDPPRTMRVALCGLEGAATAATFWLIALCPKTISGRIQVWLVVCSLIGSVGYLARWSILARSWVWTPAAIVCAITAVAIFMRPAVGRLLIYGLAALYAGYWLVLGVPGFVAGFQSGQPWQVSALSLVPGIGLVILPATYCCLVATTYLPRRSSGPPPKRTRLNDRLGLSGRSPGVLKRRKEATPHQVRGLRGPPVEIREDEIVRTIGPKPPRMRTAILSPAVLCARPVEPAACVRV